MVTKKKQSSHTVVPNGALCPTIFLAYPVRECLSLFPSSSQGKEAMIKRFARRTSSGGPSLDSGVLNKNS